MKKIFGFILISSICLQASAQTAWNESRWQAIIEKETPADVKISSQLYQLAQLSLVDKEEATTRLRTTELRINRSDNRLNVEIVYRNDENIEKITDRINEEYLRGHGLEVAQTWNNRASVWIKLEDVIAKSRLLGKDYFMFLVTQVRNDNEGPGLMNSNTYNAGAAPGGSGRRVAIFDGAFLNLAAAVTNGHAKTPAYVGDGGNSTTLAAVNGGDGHGTACVETFYDHCPDAVFEVYANSNPTEKGAAVADCIAHGVDVISMSQSEYNLGWFDNTGAACQYAQDAANAGILFLTSCGNRANSHYEAVFSDADGDDRHAFSGTDESNNITSNIADDDKTHCYLSWNSSAGADYDIYICRTTDNAVLASSTNTGTGVSGFETVSWTNTTGASVGVYFRVVKKSGGNTTFEMFTHNAGDYQYATAAGSNTSPSNTTNPNVISVGAVTRTSYDDSTGATNIIAGYSSQGPTNSGNMAPDITGPTNTNTWITGSFGGTSCATPNVAGAITAFWSANSYLDATGVRQIMIRKAQLYKDWGTAGADNIYGNGGLFLYKYASNLRYMLRSSTNAAITNATRPYYSLAVAQDNAPANATVIILNSGNYVETGLYGVAGAGSGKRILYRAPFRGVSGNFGF